VSDEGTLIYRKALAQSATRRLVWMDRSGKASPPIGPPSAAAQIRLSPDGKRVVFSEGLDGAADDIWVYDLDRDVKLRLTTDPALDHNPVWSPDGTRLVFDSHRSGDAAFYVKPSSGAVPEQLLLPSESGVQQGPRDWSSDGQTIVYQKLKTGSWNVWVLPLSGDRKPFPYKVSPFNEMLPALSPNGRWLAYQSDESGKFQIVVQPFPDPSSGKWQISTEGGAYPRWKWKRDGRELYYVTPAGEMIAVSVTTDSKFDIGKSTALFHLPLGFAGVPVPGGFPYDVTADGQRFLIAAPLAASNASPITVILNWIGRPELSH
jgi:Tol biopolymer transport system component